MTIRAETLQCCNVKQITFLTSHPLYLSHQILFTPAGQSRTLCTEAARCSCSLLSFLLSFVVRVHSLLTDKQWIWQTYTQRNISDDLQMQKLDCYIRSAKSGGISRQNRTLLCDPPLSVCCLCCLVKQS